MGRRSNAVSLNFVSADIDTVIQAISKITGHNFVVDPRVKGTVNIVSNTPVAPSVAYQMLLAALRLQGYVVIEQGGVRKILPEADAKTQPLEVATGYPRARGDKLITQVFDIKNESATALAQVLRPLITPNNTINAVASSNTLVISDYADNVRRIASIIAAIDLPSGEVTVIPLQRANASELAPTLSKLMDASAGADATQKMTIIAEDRSNALIVRTGNPGRLQALRNLIRGLDITGPSDNVHVIYLRNAEASVLAQTLSGVLSGTSGAGVDPALAPLQHATGTFSSTSSSSSSSSSSASRTISSSAGASGSAGGGKLPAGITILADPQTNALIITAPPEIYGNLRAVIDKLDRRRAQVYIEALVVEMSSDRTQQIGFQWQSLTNGITSGRATGFGGTNFGGSSSGNILSVSQNPLNASAGMNLLIGRGTVTLPGSTTPILNLAMLANFLEGQSHTNILSAPTIVTLDNQPATIVVGQNIPIVTGQYTNTGSTSNSVNPFQTISRQDVGLTLTIKPQISEGGVVRLQIYEESSAIVTGTASNTLGPTTTKRSIETAALVDDGAIIALGGLMQDSYTSGRDKVPLLGDIPGVGALFRYDTRSRSKTNLVIFLRPKILWDSESYRDLTSERYRQIMEQQKVLDTLDRLMREEASAPQLPPLPAPNTPAAASPAPDEQRAKEESPAPAAAAPSNPGTATPDPAPASTP